MNVYREALTEQKRTAHSGIVRMVISKQETARIVRLAIHG